VLDGPVVDVGVDSALDTGVTGDAAGDDGPGPLGDAGGRCGDGTIDPSRGEQCEFDPKLGVPFFGGVTCESLGYPMSGADPICTDMCRIDSTPCGTCGDGSVGGPEECDGSDLGGETCASRGFTGGNLACSASCAFDTSGCTSCGNGIVEIGEACDDGNTAPGDGCSATCQPEPGTCDPDGVYTIISGGPIVYSCCLGLVDVNITGFTLSADGAMILSSPSNPISLSGAATMCPVGSFSNSGTIPGGCTESYALSGSFTGPDTWSGIYTLSFVGPDCDCFGGTLGTPCINQSYPITAMR
jgi:cysteine-rich repeat protein